MDNETEMTSLDQTEIIRVIEKIELYYMPFLVAFGSIGNCLSVIVFFSTKLRKLSSSFYLSALAVSDTGFLFIIFISWLNMVDIPFFNQPVVCEVSVYVSSVCSFLSVWFVVAFTVERFIAVGYPLKRPSMCTVSRAKIVITCLTVTSLLLYLPHLFIAGLQPKEHLNLSFENFSESSFTYQNESTIWLCGLNKEYYELSNVLNSIDFFIVLLLPVITIFMINTSICMTVWRLARIRRTMTLTASENNVNGIGNQRQNARGRSSVRSNSSQSKVTKMLLIVSTVFVCLNLPSYICRLILHFQEKTETQTMIAWQQASLILFNTNFGINFVLYCVSGQNFRKALFMLCCPRRGKTNETTRVTGILCLSSVLQTFREEFKLMVFNSRFRSIYIGTEKVNDSERLWARSLRVAPAVTVKFKKTFKRKSQCLIITDTCSEDS